MTEAEVQIYIGKPVRLTLADGRILAGTLHADNGGGHGHAHYSIVSDPIEGGGKKVTETLHGPDQITEIQSAASDPAAVE